MKGSTYIKVKLLQARGFLSKYNCKANLVLLVSGHVGCSLNFFSGASFDKNSNS